MLITLLALCFTGLLIYIDDNWPGPSAGADNTTVISGD